MTNNASAGTGISLVLTLLLSTCYPGSRVRAQTSNLLEVVTKTIEDTHSYATGKSLAVEGEKAEIFVETWDRESISVKVVITARHERLETAKREVENVEFITERAGNKLFLKNKLSDSDLATESDLSIHYYITLPEECPVYLKSHFGGATISNLKNQLRINGEFSAINIDNVQGLLDIRTRFGDITGERIDGNVVINSRRSDINLLDVGGNFTINAQYGELRLSPNLSLRALQVNADKSDVYIYEPIGGEGLAYQLSSNNGTMALPDNRRMRELERTEESFKVRIDANREVLGNVTVSVSFGSLHLEKQTRKLERRSVRF